MRVPSPHEEAPAGPRSYSPGELRDMVALRLGPEHVPRTLTVLTDTTDFFRVEYGNVLVLEGTPYVIRNYEREGRFTVDEEPKFWVRRAVDLTTGGVKIIKMVFSEGFTARVGGIAFECFRSAAKEGRVLELMRGHPHFMQGEVRTDDAGNPVRVIDFLRGGKFADHVVELGSDHEDYFFRHFPAVLDEYIGLLCAINTLHYRGERHGDIRRDHIIRRSATGANVWIDFDLDYLHRENKFGYDLFGLGNILGFVAGRGDVTVQELVKQGSPVFGRLRTEDMNIVFHHRVMNLAKVFPYIPKALNTVLLRFSEGADVFYDTTAQLLNDLQEVRESLQSE
jgi:hypothetical protein